MGHDPEARQTLAGVWVRTVAGGTVARWAGAASCLAWQILRIRSQGSYRILEHLIGSRRIFKEQERVYESSPEGSPSQQASSVAACVRGENRGPTELGAVSRENLREGTEGELVVPQAVLLGNSVLL